MTTTRQFWWIIFLTNTLLSLYFAVIGEYSLPWFATIGVFIGLFITGLAGWDK